MHCQFDSVHGEVRDSLYEVAKTICRRGLRLQRWANEGQQDEGRAMYGGVCFLDYVDHGAY